MKRLSLIIAALAVGGLVLTGTADKGNDAFSPTAGYRARPVP